MEDEWVHDARRPMGVMWGLHHRGDSLYILGGNLGRERKWELK